MLSQPTSSIGTRRKAHRRQKSTPNMEVGESIRKGPAAASSCTAPSGIQRAHSHRGHRRGLSLDQPRSLQPLKLIPTLESISQGDISVNFHNNTNPAGPIPQYRNTTVAQSSLAQPGQSNHHHHHHQHPQHPHFQNPIFQPIHGLGLQTREYPFPTPSHVSLDHLSPLSPALSGTLFAPGSIIHGSTHQSAQQRTQQSISPCHVAGPSPEQIAELDRHIKSIYGTEVALQINILPTPVSTPIKQSSIATNGGGNIDMPPIPHKFDGSDLKIETAFKHVKLKFEPQAEPGYESSFYLSPTHTGSISPEQPSVMSFVRPEQFSHVGYSTPDNTAILTCSTILADVEKPVMLASDDASPANSPSAVSIADLSIDGGTIEETGIPAEAIQQYISTQDRITHRWRCLFPGCEAKTFGRRENIRSHVQTHLGDRQYRCNTCAKCFVRQHDLKRHAKIHSGNKPYKCPCSAGFARQDALTRHRQRGMCIGAFPDAVRKQSKRGRPRKVRPDMEARLEKAARTRQYARRASSVSSVSEESEPDELSSSEAGPHDESNDSVRSVRLPEDDELENSGRNYSLDSSMSTLATGASRQDLIMSYTASPTTAAVPIRHPGIRPTSTDIYTYHPVDEQGVRNLAASLPASPEPSSPRIPSTPALVSSDFTTSHSSDMDPPTSPLGASTSTLPSGVMEDYTAPSIFDGMHLHLHHVPHEHGDDDIARATATTASESLNMSLSFASNSDAIMSSFPQLDFLKEAADDDFRSWYLDSSHGGY